jgi:hypothetical protein
VAQCIAGTVQAGTLAVPDAHDAVVGAGTGGQFELASPHRCGGELFIHTRDQAHVVFRRQCGQARQQLVKPHWWAALVTRDKGGNPPTRAGIAFVLLD